MSRRAQIAMSAVEARAFLAEQRTVTCATLGPRGWPHLAPLWYVLRGDDVWAWTFAKSQKTRNLERDQRATLQVEAGALYHELRGVVLECDAVLHRDPAVVEPVAVEIARRYGGAEPGPEGLAVLRAQVPKRVALQFVVRRRASWDHGKLGDAY